ncbi:MAG: hypothetical protein QM736_02535 [Vicinamibacterales bacterium]
MTNITRNRTFAAGVSAVALATTLSTFGSAAAPRFFDDDPVWAERDTESAAHLKLLEVDLVTDLAVNLITGSAPTNPVRAQNVNTVDEVPDSSWFTNRAGFAPITAADVRRGPDRTNGPSPGSWTITSSKSDGVTPGFTVKDADGRRWFLKFDPPGYRGMSTGTEVAATKLMWALGYNVPENRIAYLRREQLVVGSTAKFTPRGGHARPMRAGDIDTLLERADREPDGSYRVVASLALEGTPVGRIRFQGTRPDDPNDSRPAREPPRAARLRRVRRLVEPCRRQSDQLARYARDGRIARVCQAPPDRLRIVAGERWRRPGGSLGGDAIPRRAIGDRAPDDRFRLHHAEAAARGVLRVAVDRPAAARQRAVRPASMEAAGAKPGVPARAT